MTRTTRWTARRSALAGMTVLLGTAAAVLVAPVAAQADGGCAVAVDSVTVDEETDPVAVFKVHRVDTDAGCTVGAFDYTVTDGTATPSYGAAKNGFDYTSPTQVHVEWTDVNTDKMIVISIKNDTEAEPDEQFEIQLSSANLTLVPSTTDLKAGHATALIYTSDPMNSVVFTNLYDCWEWPEPMCPVQISFPVTSPEPITITYDTFDNDGGATPDRDYESVHNGRIVVAAGASSATIELTVIGDGLRESPESFGLRFAASSGGASNGGSTVVQISDGR